MIEQLRSKVQDVLDKNLPSQVIKKTELLKILNSDVIRISIYTSEETINQVRFQYPDFICLYLSDDLNLRFGHHNGCGGQSIFRKIDPNIESEKRNALGVERLPFRTPRPNEKSVLSALKRVCENYIKTLQDIKNRDLLRHTDKIDYSFLN